MNEIVMNDEGKGKVLAQFKEFGVEMIELVNFWTFMYSLHRMAKIEKLNSLKILRGVDKSQKLGNEKQAIDWLAEVWFVN